VLSKSAGHRHLAQPSPRGRQPALEEDRSQTDDADLARELGVVELDPAGTVGAEQHPEREEGYERGDAGPMGAERDDDARQQDRTDEQKHGAFVHASIFTGASRRRRRRMLSCPDRARDEG